MLENKAERDQIVRNNWKIEEVKELYSLSFPDLMYQAQTIHRTNFNPNTVQASTLLSIKTGGCAEDCSYCPQSVHHTSSIKAEPLMPLKKVLENATIAKESGASRFCMGAAWRNLKDRDLEKIVNMISEVKKLGLETCVTLGMLEEHQAKRLKEAGLDYYNHNLDTSPDFYGAVVTTRTYQERLDTLCYVRDANINVCSGGIVGMGESSNDRVGLLVSLANMPSHPQSVPINLLVQVEGTPLDGIETLDAFEFVRTIAVTRIIMPKSFIRLSAGREHMSDELQAMSFLAGVNSIFYGDKLLTTGNPDTDHDQQLFNRLGISISTKDHQHSAALSA